MLPAILHPINRHDSYLFHLFHLFLSVFICFGLGCRYEPRPSVGCGVPPVFCNEGNVFRKSKNVVGLDIGSSAVKAVKIKAVGKG